MVPDAVSLCESSRDARRHNPLRELAIERQSLRPHKRKPHGHEFRNRGVSVAGTGLEVPAISSEKTDSPPQGGAESGEVCAESDPIEADLQLIIDAWPGLTDNAKAEIEAMVDSAIPGE